MHDVTAIQNSKMPGSIALTQKLLYAVNAISPGAMIYFEDLKGDKNFSDIFPDKGKIDPPDVTHESQEAREALRQVKHALNAYQDSLWSALVRARNYLSASIVVTGLVRHLLLCMVILLGHTLIPNPGISNAIVTAAAYYITGAVAGLFGRFYNEANCESAPDDYGLFLSRLIATPLLSGLAAIGGVLITSPLHPVDKGGLPALGTIFSGTPMMDYLLAAAVFGFAPNLIMASFQQKTQRYATDLQNTKGEATKSL